MISQNQNPLASQIGQLRYAIATTTCRETVDALQKMLSESEARLKRQNSRAGPSETKTL